MADDLKKVSKSHTIYKDIEGKRVPGVTTVLGILNKPALVPWANKLGLEGIDSSKYVDQSARIGTLSHYLVQCHLTHETPDTIQYSPFEIDKAENALLSYYEWEKTRKIEPIANELPLVSNKYDYGGTIDLYAKIDGILTICDFKTGSGIYEEHYYQVCAYRQLIIEKGFDVNQVRILNIPRKDTEEFEEKIYINFDKGWQIFQHCLAIYNLKKDKG